MGVRQDMEDIWHEPDLMIPAQRTSDVGPVVPRQGRGESDGVAVGDVVALSEVTVGSVNPARGIDLTRVSKQTLLGTEITAAVVIGLLTGMITNVPPLWLALLVGLTLVVHYYSGVEAIRPGLPRLTRLLRDMAIPFSVVAAGAAFFGVHHEMQRGAALVIFAMTATAAVGSVVRRRHLGPVRLAVMGDPSDVVRIATSWAGDHRAKVVGGVVVGASEVPPGTESVLSAPVVTDSDDIAGWVESVRADVVVVVPGPSITSERVQRLGWQMEQGSASISLLSPLAHVAPARVDAVSFAGTTLIHVGSARRSAFVRGIKSIIDRVAGAALLVLASPLLVFLVALIRIDSRGPGLFKQTRVGKDGAEFVMYKLRSMRRDAEQTKADLADQNEGAGLLFKMKADPRITRVGRVIRKTSLDELPQLINVVKGEMSLVGPRPALPEEVAQYDARERRRLAVLPGITGLWQVSGRSNLSWEKSIALDLKYTDNWRLVDDVGIVARTAGAVVGSKGAY